MRRLIRTIVTPAIALLSTAAVAGDASPTPNGSGDAPAAPPPAATPPAPVTGGGDLDELKKQMAEMQARLDSLARK